MWEAFAKLLTETIPLETRTRIVACSAFLGLIFFMLWTTGALPFFAGFAPAQRLQALTVAINQHQAEEDKDSILTLRQTECSLPTGASKALYTSTISTRMDEYFRLTGQGFLLPNCSDF